jgi:hypothetical protein
VARFLASGKAMENRSLRIFSHFQHGMARVFPIEERSAPQLKRGLGLFVCSSALLKKQTQYR